MKKLFLLILLTLSTFAFSEDYGIFGINMGTTKQKAEAAMIQKGWKISLNDEDLCYFTPGSASTYGNLKVQRISFFYSKNQLSRITIRFESANTVYSITNLSKYLINKWSLISTNSEIDSIMKSFVYYNNDYTFSFYYSEKQNLFILTDEALRKKVKEEEINSDI